MFSIFKQQQQFILQSLFSLESSKEAWVVGFLNLCGKRVNSEVCELPDEEVELCSMWQRLIGV